LISLNDSKILAMFRKPTFAVIVVSFILFTYCVLINSNAPLFIIYLIFAFSPFLLVWLAFTIIRFGNYEGKELDEGEEFGYQDKNKDELWVL